MRYGTDPYGVRNRRGRRRLQDVRGTELWHRKRRVQRQRMHHRLYGRDSQRMQRRLCFLEKRRQQLRNVWARVRAGFGGRVVSLRRHGQLQVHAQSVPLCGCGVWSGAGRMRQHGHVLARLHGAGDVQRRRHVRKHDVPRQLPDGIHVRFAFDARVHDSFVRGMHCSVRVQHDGNAGNVSVHAEDHCPSLLRTSMRHRTGRVQRDRDLPQHMHGALHLQRHHMPVHAQDHCSSVRRAAMRQRNGRMQRDRDLPQHVHGPLRVQRNDLLVSGGDRELQRNVRDYVDRSAQLRDVRKHVHGRQELQRRNMQLPIAANQLRHVVRQRPDGSKQLRLVRTRVSWGVAR